MKSTITSSLIATLLALSSPHMPAQIPSPSPLGNTSSSPSSVSIPTVRTAFHPTGFMDIPFGTLMDSATSFLKRANYRYETFKDDKTKGWWIAVYGPFSLAGATVSKAHLSFNSEGGFFQGYVLIQGKDLNDTNSQYDRLVRIIDSKYRTKPKATKRESRKGGKRYWMDEWLFSAAQGSYEILLKRDKDMIHMTYKANQIVPQLPSAGGVSETGL